MAIENPIVTFQMAAIHKLISQIITNKWGRPWKTRVCPFSNLCGIKVQHYQCSFDKDLVIHIKKIFSYSILSAAVFEYCGMLLHSGPEADLGQQ